MSQFSDTAALQANDRERAAPTIRPRPFYWSVRREIWESRSLYIAPVAVAALVLVAFVIGTLHLPQILMAHPMVCKPGPCTAPPTGLPYSIATGAVIITGVIVSVFYCLNALYGERRDRSILFWKSLPISDLVTILSKASIPLVIVPAIIFAVTITMQLAMLALSAAIGFAHGESLPAFWQQWPFLRMAVILLYGLVTLALWYAPIYGWLLMVSAWAPRVPFLWALLPPAALCFAEKIAFDSFTLGAAILNRLTGSFGAAFNGLDQNQGMPAQFAQLAPLRFLTTPDLWIGLALTTVFLAAAVRLRRYRGPL